MARKHREKAHSIENDRPDWEGIPDEKLNRWQKIAKKTNGWITCANALTISCGVLFMNGIADYANGQHIMGTIKVGAARAGDLGDGMLADMQGVKGPKGKRIDASVDMIELGVGLPVLYATDTLPLVPLVAMAAPKVIGTIGSVAADIRGREIKVTADGGFGTAAMWIGMGSLMVAKAIGQDAGLIQDTFEVLGYAGTTVGGVLSTRATIDYVQAGFGTQASK